jgi:hypothetical protein
MQAMAKNHTSQSSNIPPRCQTCGVLNNGAEIFQVRSLRSLRSAQQSVRVGSGCDGFNVRLAMFWWRFEFSLEF